MKKLLLVLAISATLAACGDSTSETTTDSTGVGTGADTSTMMAPTPDTMSTMGAGADTSRMTDTASKMSADSTK